VYARSLKKQRGASGFRELTLDTGVPRGKLWTVHRSSVNPISRQSGGVKNMSGSPDPPLSQQAAVALHQRLLAQDPTAANDAAVA
jgi:hypothetical protein